MESKKKPITGDKPAATKTSTKPAASKPAASKPAASKPEGSKPTVAKSTATKPAETKPATAACLMQQALPMLLKSKEQGQTFNSTQTIDLVNKLFRHGLKGCSKCPKESVYMLAGAYYFELFRSRLDKFKSQVIDKEFAKMNDEATENEQEKPYDYWKSIKTKNSNTFSELINLDSQKRLLEYLIKTVQTWRKLLDVKERLNPELINQLDVFETLKSCYFIFSFYGATRHIKLTCTIYSELVLLHGQALKQHLLFAYYCQIRLCLDHGLLEKARNYLRTSQTLIKSAPKNLKKFLANVTYLIKIAECELRLLSGENVEQVAADLNELINDEHFEVVSAISGYVRCLAYFLLTKLSAKQFPSQDLVHYFNESLIFIKTLIFKWYPFLSDMVIPDNKQVNTNPPNDKQININSPIWLEFAITKFTQEFTLTYYYYAVNSSVLDSHFYFNIFVTRLSRIYGSLLWLSRNLLLSIHYDKPEVQKVKINQVKNLFVKKKIELNNISSPIRNANPVAGEPLASNTTVNTPASAQDESLVLQDDCMDRVLNEHANCSHSEDTSIYLLKKSLLKNPMLNQDDDIEVLTSYDYEKELESLDGHVIPDLIVVRQELLLLLYLINESKSSFVRYFQQLDLDILNAIYFENLSDALNVKFDKLNRNHPNLITSQFNMRCLLIYLQNIELEPSSIIDLTRSVLKKAANLGHSYEIHCFIAELVICYVDSLLNEIHNGRLNILEYDFLECEKYLAERPLYESSSPVRKRVNLRSKVKPSAPKKAYQYKMDEVRDYIQELYDLDCKEVRPKKNSVKLNFTESDEEEGDREKDKENLKMKISKLKKDRRRDATKSESQKVTSQQTATVPKESKSSVLFNRNSRDLSDLNNLTDRIGKLGFDDTFEQEVHEYLIDESSDDYYGEFRRLLHHVLDLFGSHPSIKHYNRINALLFRLSICKESTFGDEAPYYFSETRQANALRSQAIQHLQKKRKYIAINYDSKMLEFTPSSQMECKKDALSRMINLLPHNWRVLQIQFLKGAGSQSDLYLARYQRDQSPVLLKINVNSEKLRENFTEEFNQIIKLADDAAKSIKTKDFWSLRSSLDERLKRLLFDVDSTWINCFIGMFLGECSDASYRKLFKQIESYLLTYARRNSLVCVSPGLLRVVCESFVHLKEESFNHAMVSLFEPKNQFVDVYDECLGLVKKHCTDFSTLEKLRENFTKKISLGPLALITGPTLENFPFESLFYLRTLRQEVFRVPSVRFLNWMYVNLRRTNQRVKQGVSDKDVYYLINPAQNLLATENFFKMRFEELKSLDSCNWDGLVGQIPSEKELQKVLQNKDIYIYLGHNSGTRYLGRLTESLVNCLSLVMGCSSAALSNKEQMVESFGTVYNFLINGCPTYVGCLWNVTDLDIDRFAELLLKQTFKIYDPKENSVPKCSSITKAVSLSRDNCKLKYLNGAAPVVRGLPISMRLTEDCGS